MATFEINLSARPFKNSPIWSHWSPRPFTLDKRKYKTLFIVNVLKWIKQLRQNDKEKLLWKFVEIRVIVVKSSKKIKIKYTYSPNFSVNFVTLRQLHRPEHFLKTINFWNRALTTLPILKKFLKRVLIDVESSNKF